MDINNIINVNYIKDNDDMVTINNNLSDFYPASDDLIISWLALSELNLIEPYKITIEELKQDKSSETAILKNNEIIQPFSYTNANGTYVLPNTEKAKNAYVAKSQSLLWNGATTKTFFDIQGNSIEFNIDDYKGIIQLRESEETQIYVKYYSIINAINNFTDLALLKQYNVQNEWDNYVAQ
jgi:hypothetical protein